MLAPITGWLVVALHLLFGVMESAGWSQMAARFGFDAQTTEMTRSLALNQGAYNAGVAVLLGWALWTHRQDTVVALLLFVLAMAVVGGATVRWSIFVVQGVPALLALIATRL